MKNKIKSLASLLLVFFSVFGVAQVKTSVSVNPSEDAPQISKHIYGHFAEHLGRCIYGGFYVGEDSEIPNLDGVRKDIIAALKEMKIPNLRWPGGCFADTYHWKDGIGAKSERPTIVNQWWGGVTEDNSFGTHDFLNLCEALETEPYISGNIGSGTVREFADWIQYVNHDGVSPMANLRKENGREQPWDVRFWGLGNEAWGCGGNMTAEFYSNLYRQYATYMTDWSNSSDLYRVASGASDGNYNWTEVLMKNIPKNLIEAVALHSYSVIDWGNKGSATDFSDTQYFQTMQRAYKMDEYITKHTAIMEQYDPENKIDLIVDEWGGWYDVEPGTNPGFLYQQNTMRDAMIAGMTLNIFNNHAERVKMANLAQTVNVLQAVILTEGEKLILTPTYHVLKMYAVHQDAQLIPLEFESPLFTKNGETLPAISLSASRGKNNNPSISLVNIDDSQSHIVAIELSKLKVKNFDATILTSESLQDYNDFDHPQAITPKLFKKIKFKNGEAIIELPPFSVIVLEGN
ncbi:alpha-N-arabinofuranosidase [Flavobacteriaceae bacterium]|nr:alpha-N-arabinofuranosidase [Flavobacteriaceae bacterium]MDA9015739.1 alpha-N-arabinofuranosidase [Flavobacteriaceae bacterium]MDB3862018.1 alpha-N-arabinofuranosidase [Flavobacteriaceae bacterium]MDC3354268.1 alpha-N-arabinofuranosidase [Flavobacteriaceae bacterium]